MKTTVSKWAHGLGSAIITGAYSAVMASLGIAGANLAGAQIQTLNYKQVLAVALGGGLVGCVAYLKQSPLPDEEASTPTNTQQ